MHTKTGTVTVNPPFFMSILRQRLQQALDEGSSLTLETNGETWIGSPTYLDDEWVEILCVTTFDYDGAVKGKRQAWLIRLDRIDAIAAPCETWDMERFGELPTVVEGELS